MHQHAWHGQSCTHKEPSHPPNQSLAHHAPLNHSCRLVALQQVPHSKATPRRLDAHNCPLAAQKPSPSCMHACSGLYRDRRAALPLVRASRSIAAPRRLDSSCSSPLRCHLPSRSMPPPAGLELPGSPVLTQQQPSLTCAPGRLHRHRRRPQPQEALSLLPATPDRLHGCGRPPLLRQLPAHSTATREGLHCDRQLTLPLVQGLLQPAADHCLYCDGGITLLQESMPLHLAPPQRLCQGGSPDQPGLVPARCAS